MNKNVQKRNVKDTLKKKENKKNKGLAIKIASTLIAFIVILAASIYVAYLYINSKIYNMATNLENGSVLEYNIFFRRLYLSDKLQNEIKDRQLNLKLNYRGNSYTIEPQNISFENIVYLKAGRADTSKIEGLENSIAMYIQGYHFAEVSIKLPNYLNEYSNLDIYLKKSDGSYELYTPYSQKDEMSRITITKSDATDVEGYLAVYVPLKDIQIEGVGEDNTLNLGKDISHTLNLKYIPENATDKNIKVTSENEEILKVDEEGKLLPILVGDTILNIESKEISKKINTHISNYVRSISLNVNTLNLNVGDSYTINYSVTPEDAENKELVFEVSDPNVLAIESNVIKAQNLGAATVSLKTSFGNLVEAIITVNVVEKKKTQNSSDVGLTYINGILIANKTYALPSTYNPGGLTRETQDAFNKMKQAAASEGINLWIASGFRSYATQQGLYARYVAGYGQAAADTFSARAGHSEHQTGLAMDVNNIEDWFGDTKEGKWLAENCHKYGFIIRYPKSKEAITGYKYEPWHIRYLGETIATDVYNSGLCLEEYLNITSKYN